MIFVGLDDTDTLDHPGTNQLARHLVALVRERFCGTLITRHQLLDDPRVPYTSRNGSAAILFEPVHGGSAAELAELLRPAILEWCPAGSDPGFCVAEEVPPEVVAWGRRCQTDLVTQREALELAGRLGIMLEGLGGTRDGVIGALAAIGLVSTGNDGRVIHLGTAERDLYDVSGLQTIEGLTRYGVAETRVLASSSVVRRGRVDVGKRLRPNYRDGKAVLFVQLAAEAAADDVWQAVRVV